MAIGWGFSEEKIKFWMAWEKAFKKAYPDLKCGEGVTFKVDTTKYEKMLGWTKELGRVMRESREEKLDELVMKMWRGK